MDVSARARASTSSAHCAPDHRAGSNVTSSPTRSSTRRLIRMGSPPLRAATTGSGKHRGKPPTSNHAGMTTTTRTEMKRSPDAQRHIDERTRTGAPERGARCQGGRRRPRIPYQNRPVRVQAESWFDRRRTTVQCSLAQAPPRVTPRHATAIQAIPNCAAALGGRRSVPAQELATAARRRAFCTPWVRVPLGPS